MSIFLPHEMHDNVVAQSLAIRLRQVELACPQIVVVSSNDHGRRLYSSLGSLVSTKSIQAPPGVLFFPAREVLPFEQEHESLQVICERLYTYEQLFSLAHKPFQILIVPYQVLYERLESLESFSSRRYPVRLNTEFDRGGFIEYLEYQGYRRVSRVGDVGEYSSHAATIDVFSPHARVPIRIECLMGKVFGLRYFSPETQLTEGVLDSVHVCPSTHARIPKENIPQYLEHQCLPLIRERADDIGFPSASLRYREQDIQEGRYWPGFEWFSSIAAHDSVFFNALLPDSCSWIWTGEDELRGVIDEYRATIDRESKLSQERTDLLPDASVLYATKEEVVSIIDKHDCIFTGRSELTGEDVHIESMGSLTHSVSDSRLELVLQALERDFKAGYKVIVAVSTEGKSKIISSGLTDRNIPVFQSDLSVIDALHSDDSTSVIICSVFMEAGVRSKELQFAVYTDKELFFTHRPISKSIASFRRSPNRKTISSLSQLEEKDFVVHETYGIGLFKGLKVLERPEGKGEYLNVEYAGNSQLYVPLHDFLKVGKYHSHAGVEPELTVLGSGKWEQINKRIHEDLALLTGKLLKTFAIRSLAQRQPFPEPGVEDEYFAEQFPFDETEDQLKAINEVLSDLSSKKPMDRLVCGDVGFGKTEVALRAAFKVAHSGGQVAILAPTTILVEQHLRTFKERFNETAVRIEAVSRFRSRSETLSVLEALSNGAVDIVIGTHRLLQKDVLFKQLGLLIIDEEHRFGVAQKEKLKAYRAAIDVLSLSATPIPRSLQLALYGTKDLSVMETAPFNRLPIITEAAQYSDERMIKAIRKELARGGQVFVVQHLIEGLEELKDSIHELEPSLTIGLAHGRMKKSDLEKVMHDFYSGKLQVLVSTAIIESGLDVPNANTMIVVHPEDFGLAQLYQIRGRVGRSATQAYAYLLHKAKNRLTREARQRISALTQNENLGVGFKLALQDMEIRGAGTLLGKDQSGNVQKVGFETYKRILARAVEQERLKRGAAGLNAVDEEIYAQLEPDLHLEGDRLIPEDYVSDVSERLVLYQELIDVQTLDDAKTIIAAYADRFGPVPDPVVLLVQSMCLRNVVRRRGVKKIVQIENGFQVTFVEGNSFYKNIIEAPRVVQLRGFSCEIQGRTLDELIQFFS